MWNNQGLWGAIVQFWTIEDKPRLHRRNTYFEDHQVSEKLVVYGIPIILTIVIFWVCFGMVL